MYNIVKNDVDFTLCTVTEVILVTVIPYQKSIDYKVRDTIWW